MPFTPETGSGLAAANAYITLAAFKAHHDDRGRSYAAYTDPQLQGSIVKASDYLDKRFSRLFRGMKGSSIQGLAWPRIGAFDDSGYALEGVPAQIAKATAEYALIAVGLGTDLAPAVESGIIEATETVGPISTTYKYSGGGAFGATSLVSEIPEYPEADMWVLELLRSTTSGEVYRG